MHEMWRLYHQYQLDRSLMPQIPKDRSEWPESWKETHYKSYDRLPTIDLPTPPAIDTSLSTTLARRVTHRDFIGGTLKLEALSSLLYWSLGKKPHSDQRHYPSGGARYPIEIYPVAIRPGEGLDMGVYHYNFKEHALDVLWKKEFTDEDRAKMFPYEWGEKASVALIFTTVIGRSYEKYGERSYRFSLLEAGHMGQNIALVSTAMGLRSSSMGGLNDSYFEELLDIDTGLERIVYLMLVGV